MLRPTSRHPPETPTTAKSPARAALSALPTPHQGSPAAVARPLAAGDEPARILKARQINPLREGASRCTHPAPTRAASKQGAAGPGLGWHRPRVQPGEAVPSPAEPSRAPLTPHDARPAKWGGYIRAAAAGQRGPAAPRFSPAPSRQCCCLSPAPSRLAAPGQHLLLGAVQAFLDVFGEDARLHVGHGWRRGERGGGGRGRARRRRARQGCRDGGKEGGKEGEEEEEGLKDTAGRGGAARASGEPAGGYRLLAPTR